MHAHRTRFGLVSLVAVAAIVAGLSLVSVTPEAHADSIRWLYGRRVDSSVDGIVASYSVKRNVLGQAVSDPDHRDHPEASFDDERVRELWKFYTQLVPFIARRNINMVDIFTDGPGARVAAVYRDEDDEKKWHLAIDYLDINDADGALDEAGVRDVLLHETGHMITLDVAQVLADYRECATYENEEGCSRPNSYINKFYDSYWKTHAAYLESQNAIHRDEKSQQDFYKKHSSEFITSYASTGVEEDMAESFAYFIQYGRPNGSSVAHQKVRFFYEFSFFVRLRKIIRLGFEAK